MLPEKKIVHVYSEIHNKCSNFNVCIDSDFYSYIYPLEHLYICYFENTGRLNPEIRKTGLLTALEQLLIYIVSTVYKNIYNR